MPPKIVATAQRTAVIALKIAATAATKRSRVQQGAQQRALLYFMPASLESNANST